MYQLIVVLHCLLFSLVGVGAVTLAFTIIYSTGNANFILKLYKVSVPLQELAFESI